MQKKESSSNKTTERKRERKAVLIFAIKIHHQTHLSFDWVAFCTRFALSFTHCIVRLYQRKDLCNWSKNYVGIVNVILIKKTFTSLNFSVHPIILFEWLCWMGCDTWITGFLQSNIKIYRVRFHTIFTLYSFKCTDFENATFKWVYVSRLWYEACIGRNDFIEYDKEANKYDHFLNMYEIYVIT